MRLEIVIPDSTNASRRQRFEELVRQLNRDPGSIDDVWFEGEVSDAEDAEIQAKFTPEVIASLREVQAEMKAGHSFTPGQVRESLERTLKEWRDAHHD